VQNTPLYYSCLKETTRIPDPSGSTVAAMPATGRIHAVHVADGQIACPYTRKDEDIPERERDWFTIQPGEVPCEDCRNATQGNQ
jgi:hypothetical protein